MIQASRKKSSASGSSSLVDPATLMRIKSLQARARIVVEGFMSGLHRSPYHGFSVEFTEYRQYCPGDDLRYLDWRLLARSDRYYVKRFEDETNLRCTLLVDLSTSMDYGSVGYRKVDYSRTLAATLAYFLHQQRDAIGLLTFDERVDQYIPARFHPGGLTRLLVCLDRPAGGKGTDLLAPLEQVARIVAKRGWVVLISDLLADTRELEKRFGYLRSRGHEVIVFRVLDPAERTFEFAEAMLFEDLESGRELYVDPQAARRQYLERFRAHAELLAQLCSNLGIDYFDLSTDQPLELALFDYLQARVHRGRPNLRSTAPRTAGGG